MLMFFNYGQSSSNVCFLSSFLNEDCRKPLNPPSSQVRFKAPYVSLSVSAATMAEKGRFYFVLSVLSSSLLLLLQPTGRAQNHRFDVSSSIEKTLDVLSFDPEGETLQELKQRHSTITTSSSSSSFTLQLQSRFAFPIEFHLDLDS
ncbi:hypothetical protein NE237_000936 [Protea cynaroides]|uniref:Uncharacterized protein n=1 Tax=Protea cynaroides TaxID=273540 RepID=A0A9Q0KSE1_9MAGN|nr:hypothetical protein NE237_000936 [Protea cynaroides]